jgi:NAD+ synthase (glutamine-hydrolysing)
VARARLAACELRSVPLDFAGNLARIRASLREARARGARYRVGPDLEVAGPGCQDHFLEPDTVRHAWEVLAELLAGGDTDGLLCDVGLPVAYRGRLYAARALLLDGRVLLLHPRRARADHGPYRDSRWFAAWAGSGLTPYELPAAVTARTGQTSTTIGRAWIRTRDARVAPGSLRDLEEGGDAAPPLAEVDVAGLGAADLARPGARAATLARLVERSGREGAVLAHAPPLGGDGDAGVFAGGAALAAGGALRAEAPAGTLRDVQVAVARVALPGRAGATSASWPAVPADLTLACDADDPTDAARSVTPPSRAAEIAELSGRWLWDALRQAGGGGFVLPLSGGSDSAATAAIVAALARRAARAAAEDAEVAASLAALLGIGAGEAPPRDPREATRRLLTTVFLPTRVSSAAARARARTVAETLGADHLELDLQPAVDALAEASRGVAPAGTDGRLRFEAEGGDPADDRALQNLQARLRMVAGYLVAQRAPGMRGGRGPRLVLSSANLDEALSGYLTKYDASSADLAPLGGVGKEDVRAVLRWARDQLGLTVAADVLAAPPSAELTAAVGGEPQRDERDLGLSYEELEELGRLRSERRYGPLAAFEHLRLAWTEASPREVAAKVRRFYNLAARHRHKATVLTPALLLDPRAPDDRRADPRPFLLDTEWTWQDDAIEARLARLDEEGAP